MKSAIKYLAGFLLAGFLLWWMLRDKDLGAIWEQIQQASFAGLAFAALLNLLHAIPRAWRWGSLLKPVRRGIPMRPMVSAIMIGYMMTWVVPGRVGEVVRPALLSSRERVPLGPCLGSILADRLLDGITVLVLFAVALVVQPLDSGEAGDRIRQGAFILLGLVGFGLGVLLAAAQFRRPLEVWLARRSKLVAWCGRTILRFSEGVEALRRPRLLIEVVFQSAVIWIVICLATWIGLLSCGVEISFWGVLALMPLLALGIAVPTPGNAGGYSFVMELGLSEMFKVPGDLAATAGLLLWIMVVVPPILLGVLILAVEGVSWSDLLRAAREVKNLGSAEEEASRASTPAAAEAPAE